MIMPIYVYKCRNCKARLDKLRKPDDVAVVRCDNCGDVCDKQVTAPAFAIYGGGTYKQGMSIKKGD